MCVIDFRADDAAGHWQARYQETLSKLEDAESPALRSTYMELAEHYRAMTRCFERRPPL